MPGDGAVVDASALAALLFGEGAGPEIAARLEGRPLFAPTLLRYELASVALKKAMETPEKGEDLVAALDLFLRLQIQEVQTPPASLIKTAQEARLTAYDAAYLWLARELDAELVTLDSRLNATLS
jgi:predicted nucleic acid-binding protein